MDKTDPNQVYDYTVAGFSTFLSRSLDDNGATNLESSAGLTPQARNLNYDQASVTGALGDILSIGHIKIDGRTGRISIFDDNNNEVVRLGEL